MICWQCIYAISLAASHRIYNAADGGRHAGHAEEDAQADVSHMQQLPIRYFDTHNHGDIMSYYTNDIDTLRQMISQSLPQLLLVGRSSSPAIFCIMMYYSIWMALVMLLGILHA
jgi:ATP-binding cassette subfamily B protein